MKIGEEMLIMAALLFGAGCGAAHTKGAGRLVEDSPQAALVRAFWDAHGGAAAWKKHAAVRFSYAVETVADGRRATFSDVAFRLDDYRRLWVTAEGERKPRLVKLGEGFDLDVPDSVSFALQSIRYFLSLPLASSVGRWELRQPVAPPDFEVPRVLEVVPLEPGAPVGPCIVELEKGSGPIQKIVYAGTHRFATGPSRTMELSDYVSVGGCRIARTRCSDVLREEVANVAFLSREEADARYPLSEKAPAAPVPASAPAEEPR